MEDVLPRGPKGLPFFGSLRAFRRDLLGFVTHTARTYGDVARFRLGPATVFLLSHPEMVKDVTVTHHARFTKSHALQRAKRVLGEGLLTSEGSFHIRQRRLSQPAFHRDRIAAYAQVMVALAERASAAWQPGETRDVAHEMMRLTLSVVAKTLFSADVAEEAPEIGEALTAVLEDFTNVTHPLRALLERLPLPHNRRVKEASARLDATIYRIISERRESGKDEGDLLSMLLLAQDEEVDHGQMTDQQVRDEVMTLFLAGHETTANALSWTWYLLARNPEAATKLQAELDRVLEGRSPTVQDLPQLVYTRMVLSESMRLYPPVWGIGRIAVEDHPLGDFVIPKGSVVLLSQYVIHRDSRFYPDPERFDPERWTPEAQAERPKFAYFPFSAGPRMCIGDQFAWMEGIMILATLAKRWQPALAPGHPVVAEALFTLRPKHGLPMVLEPRQSPVAGRALH